MAVPKIMGTEIEYGVIVPNDPNFDPISVSLLLVNSYQGDPQRRLLWDYDQEEPFMDARGFEIDAEFEPPDDQSNMSINTTLTNGARYYLDHAHPEFSTPECTNARDIVRFEKAGERVLEVSRGRAEPLLPAGQRILIYKNNSDRKGNSYACHENYLLDRNMPFNQIVEIEQALVRENQCQRCDEGFRHASDPEAGSGRRVTGGKLFDVVPVAQPDEHSRHARPDQIRCRRVQRRPRLIGPRCDDRHEGGRHESCDQEPAHRLRIYDTENVTVTEAVMSCLPASIGVDSAARIASAAYGTGVG